MAVTDAYATAAEYRVRTGKSDTSDDSVLDALLKAISRHLDLKTGRFFTKDAGPVTRRARGNGDARLWLPFDIASSAGLTLKCDLDGDNDVTGANETLALDTHFELGPLNADKGPEPWPFQFIEVIPGNSVLDVWPAGARIEITAPFGFPAVPEGIKEGTVAIARQLRDMQESGFTLTLQNIDAAIRVSQPASWLVNDIVRAYGRMEYAR